MLLYLVQHGEAKSEEEDPERGLTDKGFRDIARVALFCREQAVQPGIIYHSGKKRALQTAQVFSDHLRPGKGMSATDGLAPRDDPAAWARRAAEMNEDVMLAGHLPFMAKLAGLLLCGDQERTFVDFKMGGIVCLKRFDGGKWTIEWMVVPEMVR
jgi:phosphohistidine phosphatase